MKLISDFYDWYDWECSGNGPVLNRIAGQRSLSKKQQFEIIENLGYKTPPHGILKDIKEFGAWNKDERKWNDWAVVYIDEYAHCTEGKVLVGLKNGVYNNPHYGNLNVSPTMGCDSNAEILAKKYYESYASLHIGKQFASKERPSVSIRRLQMGDYVFWIEYHGYESWMSNYGDGDCFVIGYEREEPKLKLPLYAIDFVIGKEMYGVDFNTAPGTKGTGIDKFVSAGEIVKSMEKYIV